MALPDDGKLVRDRIPDIIRAGGDDPDVSVIDPADLQEALQRKLAEEVAELRAADLGDKPEEIADVLEVLVAVATELGYDWAGIEALAVQKRRARGGFADRLWLHPRR